MANLSLPLGKATVSPRKNLRAGQWATIHYTFTASHPIDDTGYVKVVFRQVSDMGLPQFDDPAAPNYCTVRTTGDCRIKPRWDRKGNTRPWAKSLYLMVRGGFLDSGRKIEVIFGDTSGGSPGWRVQTFCEDTFEFKTLVDPIATFEFKELDQSPALRIIAGPAKVAVCVAPSQVQDGKQFSYRLRLEDEWGNPSRKPRRFRHPGFVDPGVQTVEATDKATGLSARSNPIEVIPTSANRQLGRFWADLHGQTEETVGTNGIEQYFAFARDYALVDLCAHQGNEFQINDAFWQKINDTAEQFNAPGRFVTFPGYEWSGNTPLGGDRNVYYKGPGGRIVRSSNELLPGHKTRFPVAGTADKMFQSLSGPEPFVFAHVGGRYADISMHDEDLELAVEVHSAWGTFQWIVDDALERSYRVGIVGNSDGHKCRPGASYPGAGAFGCLGGLTCVRADRLDRDAVLAAYRARHVYATTGHRPLLDVDATTADGSRMMMGDVIETDDDAVELAVSAAGTAPIEAIEVRNGGRVVHTHRPFGDDDLGRCVKVIWSGAKVRGRDRIVSWDGRLRLRGNSIRRFEPINFWNPARGVRRTGRSALEWTSATTGGLAGVILHLDKPNVGAIEPDTAAHKCRCRVARVGIRPKTYSAGGLGKQIQIYRVPEPRKARRCEQVSFTFRVRKLARGDNPLYVRVAQRDGHLAWSSPIYVAKR
jgi:hypothetical protein